MLTIDHLSVAYGNHVILHDLSVTMKLNAIHGVVGLNGSGKSTLLNAIYGIKSKSAGSIHIDGNDIKRAVIGYLEAESFFYSNLTGEEYLSLFATSDGTVYSAKEWNELFKLPLNELISTYSTGMKKRLGLMAVFKQNKQVVILDEPFNGLDIEFAHLLTLILGKLREQGKTIIVTSHILESLTGICDYIHLLKDGQISFSKPKECFDSLKEDIFSEMEQTNNEILNRIM